MIKGRRKALVTGATGFVGSHLVRHLLAEEWDVEIIARLKSDLSPLQSLQDQVIVHRHHDSTESMCAIMSEAKPAVVFHLASLVLTDHRPADVVPMFQANLLFGMQLVEAMALQGVTALVNTGTSWQHFEGKDYSPVCLYAATKQAFEDILEYYIEAHDLRVVTLKLFDTYGPNDPRPKILNLLRRVVAEGGPLAMSPGEQSVELVHVLDVARAYDIAASRLLNEQGAGHESFAVSSGKPIRLRELVSMIEILLGRKLPIVWGGREYRRREVMEPWSGVALPGWTAQHELADQLKGIFCSVDNLKEVNMRAEK